MNAQLLDQLTQAISYRKLQTALKAAKTAGFEINCKLNATKEDLQVARNTLVAKLHQDWEDAREIEFLESVQIKGVISDSEEQEFLASIASEFGDAHSMNTLYEATKASLSEASVPLDLAEKAARVIAKDDPKLDDLGRTEAEQTIIRSAWSYIVNSAA